MTAFQGRAHIKIDPKGRIHLPVSFSQLLAQHKNLIVTNATFKGVSFLDVYTQNEWRKLEERIERLPQLKYEVQVFKRFYISSGEAVALDGQGRMLIPPHFRDFAELQDDVVLIGMRNKIEMWGAKKWQKLFSEMATNFDEIQSTIADLDVASPRRSHK
jgi:MraZ protein